MKATKIFGWIKQILRTNEFCWVNEIILLDQFVVTIATNYYGWINKYFVGSTKYFFKCKNLLKKIKKRTINVTTIFWGI